jgi:hypothetical protein
MTSSSCSSHRHEPVASPLVFTRDPLGRSGVVERGRVGCLDGCEVTAGDAEGEGVESGGLLSATSTPQPRTKLASSSPTRKSERIVPDRRIVHRISVRM